MKEEEKTSRQSGRDDIFLVKKKIGMHAKKTVWQAIYQNLNGGCLWMWIISSLFAFLYFLILIK